MAGEQSWEWAGARWWKFDFHTHTPASRDFVQDDSLTPLSHQDWLLAFMREKVDCVAVTDHDSAEWIGKLQEELAAMEKNPPEGYRRLVLFPGIEITTIATGHILAIFPPGTSQNSLSELCGLLKYAVDEDGTKRSTLSGIEVVETILKRDGLVIPAHLDDYLVSGGKDQGASIAKRHEVQEVKRILNHANVLAVELKGTGWSYHTPFENEVKKSCFVWGSDTHHLTRYGDSPRQPGSRYTWVKMESPTFEGLKLALIDARGSVLSYNIRDPNRVTHPVIEGVEVRGAKFLGVTDSFVCSFNPWMNAVIGGRGTGKSTLLEFLRLPLGRCDDLPFALRAEFGKYHSLRDRGCLFGAETLMRVYYRKDERRFRISLKGGVNPVVEAEMEGGEWAVEQANVSKRFPVRIYSQKEIFVLSHDPGGLLRTVDSDPEIGAEEWEADQHALVRAYCTACDAVRDAERVISEEEGISGDLSDVMQKISLYESVMRSPEFSLYKACVGERTALSGWLSAVAGVQESVGKFGVPLMPVLEGEAFCLDNPVHQDLLGKAAAVCEEYAASAAVIAGEIAKISHLLDSLSGCAEVCAEEVRISSAVKAFQALRGKPGLPDERTYADLVAEETRLRAKAAKIAQLKGELAGLRQVRKEAFSAVFLHREEITERRRIFLGLVFRKAEDISVQVVPFGNRGSMEEGLRRCLKMTDGAFREAFGDVDQPGTDTLLGGLYGEEVLSLDALQALKERIAGWYAGVSDGVTELPDGQRFVKRLRESLSPQDLDGLFCWFPEDYLQILYRSSDAGSPEFQMLEDGSPGQRSAALLTFILSYGTEPLLLDQPEDDLDNKLIYQMVVRRLREMKKRRQVIVVTHNANVVINGCAELVLPLEAVDGETQCLCSGCLHEANVRDVVCSILEGGREAFEKRYRRVVG